MKCLNVTNSYGTEVVIVHYYTLTFYEAIRCYMEIGFRFVLLLPREHSSFIVIAHCKRIAPFTSTK